MAGYSTLNSTQKPGGVVYGDGPNIDAFSRVRVSTPVGLFDSTFQYDLQPTIFYAVTANGGTVTHAPNSAGATLATDAQASSSAALQSKTFHRYIPAKSQMVVMTQVIGSAVAGVTKRAGYFETNDGIYLEQNGTTDLAWVRRTSTSGSPVNNRVAQAAWNMDTLDGSRNQYNPSGLKLDITKSSITVIDLQWLGMGRVRVGFDIGGQIVYCHEFLNANVLSVPYMKTANLPIRWEISGNAVASFVANCSSVISEGGAEFDRGYLFSRPSGTITAGNGTRTAIVAIRPAATFNSLVNRIQILPEAFNALVIGNTPVVWEVMYGCAITGGAWAANDAISATEYNITATGITGGVIVESFFGPATAVVSSAGTIDASINRLPLTLDTAGANPTVVCLAATGIGATSDVRASITWRELRWRWLC